MVGEQTRGPGHLKRTKKIIFLLFAILSLTRMIGYATQIPLIEGAGFVLGFSPLPLAFSHRSGHEDFQLEGKIETNGETIPLSPKLARQMPGWWFDRTILVIGILYAPRFPAWITDSPLSTLICDQISNHKSFKVILKKKTDADWKWEKAYACP